MKKILIATTALTLSAGFAAAEVKFSGNARFGIQYLENRDKETVTNGVRPDLAANAQKNGRSNTWLEKRLRINVDASTTTDAGVTLGGRLRLSSEETGNYNTGAPAWSGADAGRVSGARLYAQYEGFTVAVGNINGAIDDIQNLYDYSIGMTGLDYGYMIGGNGNGWDAFSSGGQTIDGIEVIYKTGPFRAMVSYTGEKFSGLTASAGTGAAPFANRTTTAASFAYTYENFVFVLAGQEAKHQKFWGGDDNFVFASVEGKFDNYGAMLTYGQTTARNVVLTSLQNDALTAAAQTGAVNYDQKRFGEKYDFVSIAGKATFGATEVRAYVADLDMPKSKTGYGLGAQYDLGGGAVLVGGVTRSTDDRTRADFGVSFRF